ncbi:MAG TPA: enhanced serine sensitivity protein SseB C-terminal domain-containing protein [Phycisphaerales bacterium]|nr:enhanced serine sensitivity protein SseB C-terminal domain-containing protein [Phycisphaerales bacterium]
MQPQRIFFGQPSQRPTKLLNSIAQALATDPHATAAYLGQMYTVGTDPAPVVTIGLAAGPHFHEARARLEPTLLAWTTEADAPVDLVDVNERGTMSDYLRSTIPFWERNPPGLFRRLVRALTKKR